MQGHAARLAHQGQGQRPIGQLPPASARRLADDDLGHVVARGVGQHRLDQIVTAQGNRRPAQLLGQLHGVGQLTGGQGRRRRAVGPLHMGHGPGRIHGVGQPPPGARQRRRHRVGAHQHQDPLSRRPGPLHPRPAHGALKLLVDSLGRPAQGHLPQRREVLGLEEILGRQPRGLWHIDLALGQPLAKLVGGDVHQLDVVGAVEHLVGHCLALAHAGDLPDHVHQAFQVLDVQRGPDVDASGDQLGHVLPALGMAGTRHIGMGVFVHQQQPRPPRQGRVDVELHQGPTAVFDGLAGQHLQPAEHRLGLGAAVGLDDPHNNINALGLSALGGLQHLVGFADSRGHPQEDLQPAPVRLAGFSQQGVGIGSSWLVQRHRG